MLEEFARKSDLRNGLSATNGSRLSIRMPSSKNRSGFSQNEHRIWIQHGKKIEIGYLDVFSIPRRSKTKIGNFYCSSGACDPWTAGDDHMAAPTWMAHQRSPRRRRRQAGQVRMVGGQAGGAGGAGGRGRRTTTWRRVVGGCQLPAQVGEPCGAAWLASARCRVGRDTRHARADLGAAQDRLCVSPVWRPFLLGARKYTPKSEKGFFWVLPIIGHWSPPFGFFGVFSRPIFG